MGLWDTRRCDRLIENKDVKFAEDYMKGDTFSDFMDWKRRNRRVIEWDERDSYTFDKIEWLATDQALGDTTRIEPDIDDIYAQVLREVLAELKQEELERKRANLRRWMHQATLHQLHARRGVLDMSV